MKGIPVALNGEDMPGYDLIERLNTIAGRHGIGRNNMIEDRILGLKAREIYEHPAATVILAAHKDLEHLTLTRQELSFKHIVDDRWSELAYMGLVHEPLHRDLNAFIESSQERVCGKVDLLLFKGCCRVLGRSSQVGIYSGDLVSFDSRLNRPVPRDRGICVLRAPGTARRAEKERIKNYNNFFPASGPGLHSKTSVIFISRRDFAGSPGFFSWTIVFIFS